MSVHSIAVLIQDVRDNPKDIAIRMFSNPIIVSKFHSLCHVQITEGI
mgnify:FL=1